MATFHLHDRVTWTSQANGVTLAKTGRVVAVVPPLIHPQTFMRGLPGSPHKRAALANGALRDHESYVVCVRRCTYYWPRVSQLRLVPPVSIPSSALEKIQSYDGSGRPGRLSAFTPLTNDELALAWEAYCTQLHHKHRFDPDAVFGRAIRAAVEAVLAKRAKPLTHDDLVGLGIQVENGYGILDAHRKLTHSYNRVAFSAVPPGYRVVKVRRITIWEKP